MFPSLLIELAAAAGFSSSDMQAMEQLYVKYQKPLYIFVNKMVLDAETAQDIMHEAFVKLLAAGVNIDSEKGCRNYLYTIAVNLCRMRARKGKNRKHSSLNELEDKGVVIQDEQQNIEKQVELRNFEEILDALIQLQPEKQRSVLYMKKIQGLTYTDIVKITGVSLRSLKYMVKNSLQEIMEQMEEMGMVQEGELL